MRKQLQRAAWSLLCLGLICPIPLTATAQVQTDFASWLNNLKQEARTRGISQATLDAAFADTRIQTRVIELDRKQPEFVETFASYLAQRVTPQRIARGQALLMQYQPLFDTLEQRHGIPRHILAAFWGLETNYGTTTGNTAIPDALATLAFEGRRSAFFRAELLDALSIIEAGHVAAADMKGSWAGAMGQMQFMPSTYRRYAVDGDRDGRINLWSSVPDALHSAGNYLNQAGWKPGEPVALEVRLPQNFDWRVARLTYHRPIADWQAAGVMQANGAPIPTQAGEAAIILPQGFRGPAFMVFDNFDVILQWNRSVSYALSVAILAQRFVADVPLLTGQGAERDALSRTRMIALQQQLAELGFDAGVADGVPGIKTQSAIRRYQSAQQLPADGYASPSLLAHVEASHASAAAAGKLAPDRNPPTFSDPALAASTAP